MATFEYTDTFDSLAAAVFALLTKSLKALHLSG